MVPRRLALAGIVALACVAPATAALHTYRTGLDLGNDPSTGCAFSLGAVAPGTLPGFELQLTVVVDDVPTPHVDSAQVETCAGGVFANPQALAGFQLQFDSGLLASDSVVGSIPLALLDGATVVRFAHHALAASGSEDALFTVDGSAQGAPIVLSLQSIAEIPAFSRFGAVLTALLLAGAAWWLLRRRRATTTLTLIALALLALGTAAAVFAAFGPPLAVDATSDAAPPDSRAEIIASFAAFNAALDLRLDIQDIPVETACSDATDNDGDGLIDCADADCAQRTCSDGNGCTQNDACLPFGGNDLVCVGSPVNCSALEGNECSADVCASNGPDSFTCESSLDFSKLEFGSCTPDANCAAHNPDGTCAETLDLCQVGRCVVQIGDQTQFVCEGADKSALPQPVGCDDGNGCTADACLESEGTCEHAAIDNPFVACDDGNQCTDDGVCSQGVCEPAPPDDTNVCTDGNECTDDACSSGVCVGTSDNTNVCSDGNDCTLTDACVDGVCAGAPAENGASCDDGVSCTGAQCSGGSCLPNSFEDLLCVTDDNPCTAQACTQTGCSTSLFTGPVSCEINDGGCVLGLLTCEAGEPVGGCEALVPPQSCPP